MSTIPPWVRFAAIIALLGVLVYVSSCVGVPSKLPGAALGWRLLFHVERAAALLGGIGVVLLIGWRGSHGEWPIKFANVEYAPKEAVAVTASTLEDQDERIKILEGKLGIASGPPAPPAAPPVAP